MSIKFNSPKMVGLITQLKSFNYSPSQEKELIHLLECIITPLFQLDGYSVRNLSGTTDYGLDFVASKRTMDYDDPPVVGIEFKYFSAGKRGTVANVDKSISYLDHSDLHQLILLSSSGFTGHAHDKATRSPRPLQLWDYDDLQSWLYRIERRQENTHSFIIRAISKISDYMARVIAEHPEELDNVEWRDLERMLARIFDKLGFQVTLTPASKDGGKDIILGCRVKGERHSYIVEVKHWRTGKRVGTRPLKDFVKVIATEEHQGGLYISSSGYSKGAFEALSETERSILRLGKKEKIVTLCQTFVRAGSPIWTPTRDIQEYISGTTIDP